MTAEKNKTMIDLAIHGTGSGFEMKLNYGKIGFSRISLNMVRVFLDNDPSGIVIKTSTGLPITRTLKAQIRPDGNLVWSTEKNSGDKSIDCIRNEIKQLHALCLKSYRSLIPVGGAGLLKDSNLARKVKIKPNDGKVTTRVVPISMVEEIDKQLYIPYWLALEKTGHTNFAGKAILPNEIEAELNKLSQEFENQLSILIEAAKPFQEAAREKSILTNALKITREVEAREAKKESELKLQIAQAKALKQDEKLAKAKKARDDSVEAITGATVSWFTKKGSKKWPEYEFSTKQDCTVRFRGSYVFATLPNGQEIMRMPQTIEVIVNGEHLTDAYSLRKTREWTSKGK